MTPLNSSHPSERRRLYHACLPCRRKKIRCPGEKPACSNCVRLRQSCAYAQVPRTSGNDRSEERLSKLEEKLDLLLTGNIPHQSHPTATPSTNSYLPGTPSSAVGNSRNTLASSYKVSLEAPGMEPLSIQISLAIELYFKYFHRQPIWCFEREDTNECDSLPEELIHSVLKLTSRCSPKLEQFHSSGDHVKTLIMLRVAAGTVEITTIESLCLLSLSFFTDGDSATGQFHLGFALQLAQSASMDTESAYATGSSTSERKRRLFWSLQLLEHLYGVNVSLPLNSTKTIWLSSFSPNTHGKANQDVQESHLKLPTDSLGCTAPDDQGIWNTNICLAWLWSRVRQYVTDCADNITQEPWRHDSMYSLLLSDFIEVENRIPMCHRYESVKFYERDAVDLEVCRDYWAPWLKEQFMYNTIQTVLNHPFLYIVGAQQKQNFAIPNSFWRRSSEMALLHSTWTARLIDMIWDKKMTLSDPFFGHAAAIAATVHLYYCCAANARLRHKSIADFATCTKFLESFSSFSPACETLKRKLDDMTQTAVGSEIKNVDNSWMSTKIYLDVRLMWDILQLSNLREVPSINLFGTSLASAAPPSTDESSILEVIVATSPEITLNTTDGGQDRPMLSFRTPTSTAPESTQKAIPNNIGIGPGADNPTFNTTPWLWADPSQSIDMGSSTQPNLALAIGDSESAAWWDVGFASNVTHGHN